jgi:hypothetical protein
MSTSASATVITTVSDGALAATVTTSAADAVSSSVADIMSNIRESNLEFKMDDDTDISDKGDTVSVEAWSVRVKAMVDELTTSDPVVIERKALKEKFLPFLTQKRGPHWTGEEKDDLPTKLIDRLHNELLRYVVVSNDKDSKTGLSQVYINTGNDGLVDALDEATFYTDKRGRHSSVTVFAFSTDERNNVTLQFVPHPHSRGDSRDVTIRSIMCTPPFGCTYITPSNLSQLESQSLDITLEINTQELKIYCPEVARTQPVDDQELLDTDRWMEIDLDAEAALIKEDRKRKRTTDEASSKDEMDEQGPNKVHTHTHTHTLVHSY